MVDKQYNKLSIVKFGDDAVDIIYDEHLSYQSVRTCCFVSKAVRERVVTVLAPRLVKRLKARYFNSSHVRVPSPGELLYEDGNGNT